MSVLALKRRRVLSGMRPTGRLHLGHYHGVLRNWLRLQSEYECFFFVADWHALTTHYEESGTIDANSREMVIDWLAAGIDPAKARVFIQSRVPEHAELHLLLSMITPVGWLERVPSYKEMRNNLPDKDLDTYGFLGYALLQSADILIYRAGFVPVGEDQVAHIEITREIARRFNTLFGRERDFEDKVKAAIEAMGAEDAKSYRDLRRRYRERGDAQALESARSLLEDREDLSVDDRERLFGYLDGEGRVILPEPDHLLTEASKMPGLDGLKMSKSYGNTIELREEPDRVQKKMRTMPTDPARVRRNDPGDPERCPVWQFHLVYSDDSTREWAKSGCLSAAIGCVECKQRVIDAVIEEQTPIRSRAAEYEAQPELVQGIIEEGCSLAREAACETMEEVRRAMGLVGS
ncbi:tryptophan--tRNA ligase [Thioalkalivibrio sp. HK1]|uniref:tryptophan--tRNA ligase n=1 Tax=Thioalkalivibrio sp. HK1 TaxID=1469245 RepID=UPI00046F59ED|nr:tryptophan--tRNA ligase [Thioalkalivibrio sp. HK1]